MIYARIEKIHEYLNEDIYQSISRFLELIKEDIEEGEYPILGNDVYARVQSYKTIPQEEAKIESHKEYIDIQFTISGAEGISVFDTSKLDISETYNEEKDVCFYKDNKEAVVAHTSNVPGYFTMLFPEDAHRPKEQIRGIKEVKKAVIKVRVRNNNA